MSSSSDSVDELEAQNVCCHYCRISKNRRRKKQVAYLSCNFCPNVFCYNCVVNHLNLNFEQTKSDSTWKCRGCYDSCCCCHTECKVKHRHCFTYNRTKKRYEKARKWKLQQQGTSGSASAPPKMTTRSSSEHVGSIPKAGGDNEDHAAPAAVLTPLFPQDLTGVPKPYQLPPGLPTSYVAFGYDPMLLGLDRMQPKRERVLDDADMLPDAKRQKQMEYSNESSATTEPRSPNGMKLSGPPLSPATYPPMPLQHAYTPTPYGMYPSSPSPGAAQYAQAAGTHHHTSWLGAQQGRFPSPVPTQHFTSQPPQPGSLMSPLAQPVPMHAQQYQYAAAAQRTGAGAAGFPSSNAVFHHQAQQYHMSQHANAHPYGDMHNMAARPGTWIGAAEQDMPAPQSYQQWASHGGYGQPAYHPNKMYAAGGLPPQYHHGHHAAAMAGGFPRMSAAAFESLDPSTSNISFLAMPPSTSASPTTAVSENSPRPSAAATSTSTEDASSKKAASVTAPASLAAAATAAPLSSVSLPSFQELAAQ